MLYKKLVRTCAASIGLTMALLAAYPTEGHSMATEEQWQARIAQTRQAIAEHAKGEASGHNNAESYSAALRTIREAWINSDLNPSNLRHQRGAPSVKEK